MQKLMFCAALLGVSDAVCGPRINIIENKVFSQRFENVGRYGDPVNWKSDWVATFHKNYILANWRSIFSYVASTRPEISYSDGDASIADLRADDCVGEKCNIINLELTIPYTVCHNMETVGGDLTQLLPLIHSFTNKDGETGFGDMAALFSLGR